jgi:hypothetical protein
VLVVSATGCGADDETSAAPPRDPELTIPRTEAEPPPPETTETTETVAPPTTETAPPPTTETTPPVDSPENDTPPPEGSPAERFEDFCNENPGACG